MQQRGLPCGSPLLYRELMNNRLGEFVGMQSQARLEVGSLVAVDDVALSQLVQHRTYLRQELLCSSLVSGSTQYADSIAGGLSIVMVVCLTGSRLADTLQR